MTTVQDTRLSKVQQRLGRRLKPSFTGPWAQRSLVLIALLSGFFLGSNLTVHLDNAISLRTFSAMIVLAICECLVRLRSRVEQSPLPFAWHVVDNLRLGLVYAVVLEAFKVGS